MTCENGGVSASAEELEMCTTCLERIVYAKGECRSCYVYRGRTGNERPARVIVANGEVRQHGAQRGSRTTVSGVLRQSHSIICGNRALVPGGELCGVCGTITRWQRDRPMPLCLAHLGAFALIATIFNEPDELPRVSGMLTV